MLGYMTSRFHCLYKCLWQTLNAGKKTLHSLAYIIEIWLDKTHDWMPELKSKTYPKGILIKGKNFNLKDQGSTEKGETRVKKYWALINSYSNVHREANKAQTYKGS